MGGSGYVTEIASLQRCLEVVWYRGFNIVGSNYFKRKIYGSKKWIETTECAPLLCFCFYLQGKRDVSQVHGPMDRLVIK